MIQRNNSIYSLVVIFTSVTMSNKLTKMLEAQVVKRCSWPSVQWASRKRKTFASSAGRLDIQLLRLNSDKIYTCKSCHVVKRYSWPSVQWASRKRKTFASSAGQLDIQLLCEILLWKLRFFVLKIGKIINKPYLV